MHRGWDAIGPLPPADRRLGSASRSRGSRSRRSRTVSVARPRRSRRTSTTLRGRRPEPSRLATWAFAAAAGLTCSATGRRTPTRTSRPAIPARSGCARPASTCWQRCARRTGNWLVDLHFRNANPRRRPTSTSGSLLQVVHTGSEPAAAPSLCSSWRSGSRRSGRLQRSASSCTSFAL